MRSFFDANSLFWKPFGWLGDLLILSLLWTVCSLPLLTLGGATAALYDAVVMTFRRGRPHTLARYFETFRAEWKRGLLPTLLWGLALGLLFALYSLFTARARGDGAVMLAAGLLFLLAIPVGAFCWVFPLLSRFTLDFRTLNLNALRLALGHLPRTLALAVLSFGALWLTLRLALLPLMVLPGLLCLFWSFLLEPVFEKYEKESQT